jgi:hypothetical protein
MRFLFWNLNRRDIHGFVRHVARGVDADIVILAECAFSREQLLISINDVHPHYQYAWGVCNHLVFLSRFDASFLHPVLENHRVSIRRLTLPGRDPILLAAAHLPSKVSFSEESQVFEAMQLSRMVDDAEREEGHQRTILLGDLNMNPFESGMVAARGGLNAVMSRAVAAAGPRVVQKEKHPYFYNPMWNHLGDRGPAAGTFYYESGEPVCYFWNLFDQVLIRPALLKDFSHEHVRIVTEVPIGAMTQPATLNLLSEKGHPNKEMTSDHLPVLLELNF